MRRSKEIIVLLTLLVGAMAFVLWYVIDRRAANRAAAPLAPRALAPEPPAAVTLQDRKTLDFSSGQPVVKETAEDRAALEAGAKDLAAATKGVTFKAAPKTPPAPPAPPTPAP